MKALTRYRKVLVPKLETIVFEDALWRSMDEYQANQEGELTGAILRVVEARKKAGSPIHRIEILDCKNMDQRDIEPLKQVVDIVEWDSLITLEDENSDEEEGTQMLNAAN